MDEIENLVTVIDDDGIEHIFEELDRIETDDGQKYIALLPVTDDEEGDDELIILRVSEESGDTVLEPIEDDDEFDEIAAAFEERLAEMFDFEE